VSHHPHPVPRPRPRPPPPGRRGAPPGRPPQAPRAPAAAGGTPRRTRPPWTEDREPRRGPSPPPRRAPWPESWQPRRARRRRPLRGILHAVEARVDAVAGEQLAVRSLLAQLALVQDEDAVGVLDGREPVRDDERRPPLEQLHERVLDE